MLAWFLVVACDRDRSLPLEGPPPEAPLEAASPTYHRDIAPLLATHCTGCHQAGGIAPFSLVRYEEAQAWAPAIAHSTQMRTMPPFNLDNSGECNTYLNAPWLTDAQIATLGAWAQAGAPEGEPVQLPPAEPPPQPLARVDLTLEMTEPYTPDASLQDDYRCFLLDPGLTEDQFVTASVARYGAPGVVHHMTLFALDSAEDEAEAEALDEAFPGPGYPCIGDPLVDSRWVVGSGPGDMVVAFPEGTGVRLRAGRKAVLQMHYNLANGAVPDQTALDLTMMRRVPHEAEMLRAAVTDLELPPGEPMVVQSDTLEVRHGHTLWGLWPHMHNLGTRLRVTATRGDQEICLAQVNHYQFHWQAFEFYTQPIHLQEGDIVQIDCVYDTTSRETTTTWGEGTDDEMCIGFFYATWDD